MTALDRCHDLIRDATRWPASDCLDALLEVLRGLAPRPICPSVPRGPALPEALGRQLVDLIAPGSDAPGPPPEVVGEAVMHFTATTVRKLTGAFHTPPAVVEMVVDCAELTAADVLWDPAAGSGAFLQAASRRRPGLTLLGRDTDARSVAFASLGLLAHEGVVRLEVGDSLEEPPPADPRPTVVLTNPPFGVTHRGEEGGRRPGELVFVERSLDALAPGGRLWAVLPRSVLTNKRSGEFRRRIDGVAHLRTVIRLPPETFARAGTTVATVVIELVRRGGPCPPDCVVELSVSDVGHDGSGRPTAGEDVASVAQRRRELLGGDAPTFPGEHRRLGDVGLDGIAAAAPATTGSVPLGTLCAGLRAGRTPGPSAFASQGHFIVKVGNLTGRGVSWIPRARNFVTPEALARSRRPWPDVRAGDILFTAVAHKARYIGLKVDYVWALPDHLPEPSVYSAEVMRVRPDPDRVDGLALYAWLRSAAGYRALQRLVRGQTGHVYPDDLAALPVDPDDIARMGSPQLRQAARACLEQAHQLQQQWRALEDQWAELDLGESPDEGSCEPG